MSITPENFEKSAEAAAEAEIDEAVHQQEATMMDDEVTDGDVSLETEGATEDLAKEQEQRFLRLSADFAN